MICSPMSHSKFHLESDWSTIHQSGVLDKVGHVSPLAVAALFTGCTQSRKRLNASRARASKAANSFSRAPCRQFPFRVPVGAPPKAPCIRHTRLPRTAGALQDSPDRFDVAVHLGACCKWLTGPFFITPPPSRRYRRWPDRLDEHGHAQLSLFAFHHCGACGAPRPGWLSSSPSW
jgi:hypothetical protein